MSMFTIEPLWYDDVPQPVKQPDDPNIIRLDNGMLKCRDCGELVRNEALFAISHSMCFNGWCSSHLISNNGACPEQLEWLEAHGFIKVDRFDPAFWNLP